MDLLRKLINAHGISGSETEIREIIAKEVKKYADVTFTDRFGNLIVKKNGRKPKLMLAAHMDEIGLMVKNIETNGEMYITAIGGIEPITLIGQRVSIKTNKKDIIGVISTEEISDDYRVEKLPGMNNMFVDAGLSKKELEKLGVGIGTYLSLIQQSGVLGKNEYVFGKALDDRVGCYILIEVLKRLKKTKNEVYFVFTVQEEIGLYGSRTSAYKVEPDWAIAVDVVNSDDHSTSITKSLGKGPCITIKDAGMITDKCIDEWLNKRSKKLNIPIQIDVNDSGVTDALNISISKGGVPSTVVGPAVRNIHTTMGIVNTKDIEQCIELLADLIKNPPPHICGVQ